MFKGEESFTKEELVDCDIKFSLLDFEWFPIFEFFLLAFVPGLDRPVITTYSGINFTWYRNFFHKMIEQSEYK